MAHMAVPPISVSSAAHQGALKSVPMGMAGDAANWLTAGLDETMLAADPHEQFERWMADVVVAGLPEPTAMVLATVSAAGQPRARTVLLKGHDPSGFVFFT